MAQAELDEAARDGGENGLRAVELRREVLLASSRAGELSENTPTSASACAQN